MRDVQAAEPDIVDRLSTGVRATAPVVSVIVANFNGAAYLDDCLQSALSQSLRHLEVIVIDDGSTDDSVLIIERRAERDARVRLIRTEGRLGPGAARNLGLDVAQGVWIAILDSDDMMHPRRLADLIEQATRSHTDIVADNQIVFDDDGVQAARRLLTTREVSTNGAVSPIGYVESNRLFSGGTPLGYLKPVFSRSLIDSTRLRYNPDLLVSEDYDFVLRLLLAGARLQVCPQLTYFYRRHSASISHRLSRQTLLPMLAADDALRIEIRKRSMDPSLIEALDRRRKSIAVALEFDELIRHLRARRLYRALALCVHSPQAAGMLRIPVRDRLLKLARLTRRQPSPVGRRITLLSRQRIVGATNGSSVYLLSLCAFLKQAGFEIDLVSPSPAMFGRWPFLRLRPEMSVFSSHRIRGAVKVGKFVVARDPRIAMRAVAGLAGQLLDRAGVLGGGKLDRKAPHAVGVPLTDDDRIFIAGATRPSALLLVDYAFLTDAIPFALQPGTASAVVMHDLFSAQDAHSPLRLEQDAEITLLAQADAVITIQADETEIIKRHLPAGTSIILSPMAVDTVSAAQPGRSETLLFVGSNTGPNIDGICWFLREVWPSIVGRHPQARLRVAGSCCVGVTRAADGVELLGRVDDLGPFYADAGIVISPLRSGSGLKIKLVEALGQGKAVIATETTLQGVKDLVAGAVLQADSASQFAEAIESIIADRPARQILGERALSTARRHFSTDACYAGLLNFIDSVAKRDEFSRGEHAAHR